MIVFCMHNALFLRQNMVMKIKIHDKDYSKEWLLNTAQGQKLLADAKSSSERPQCTCREPHAKMYIATRGEVHYLARMPGTAKQHAEDCQSHILPNSVYANELQAPSDILKELWCRAGIAELPDDKRYWAAVRGALYLAAGKITVDDALLSTRLLIPKPFEPVKAKEIERANIAFYKRSEDDDDGSHRYWTIGIVKSITPAKYNSRMVIKHMPGISFWVPEEKALAMPVPSSNQILIAMFTGRPVKTGVIVSDIVGILVTQTFIVVQPIVATPAITLDQEECGAEDKVACVSKMLGLPIGTPRRVVLDKLIEHFLCSPNSSGEACCPKLHAIYPKLKAGTIRDDE